MPQNLDGLERHNYVNFVIDKTRSKFKANHMFTDFSKGMSFLTYRFSYSVDPDYNLVYRQAQVFANSILSMNVLHGPKTFYAKTYHEASVLLINAYIYSYMKAVWYGTLVQQQEKGGFRPHRGTKLFIGHKTLYDIICDGSLYTRDPLDNYNVVIDLDCDRDVFDKLLSFECVTTDISKSEKVYYDEKRNTIFSPQLESVLVQLLTDVDDLIMCEMSTSKSMYYEGLPFCPVGNSCFSSDKATVHFIETISQISHRASAFWGIACQLTMKSQDLVDNNDSVYDDFYYEDYDTSNVTFEVYSITGFNPYSTNREDLQNQDIYGPTGPGGLPSNPKA